MEFKNLEIELNNLAQEMTETYKDKLLKSKASGNLISSISVKIKRFNSDYRVQMDLADYWKYIEEGRKPGTFPNVNSLVKWIKDKGIQPTGGMTEQQLAYVIGNKIKRDGIKPKPYLKESVNSIPDIGNRLAKALINDLKDFNELKLNNKYVER